jgi:hypothetical protein
MPPRRTGQRLVWSVETLRNAQIGFTAQPALGKGVVDEGQYCLSDGEPFGYHPKMGGYPDLYNHLLGTMNPLLDRWAMKQLSVDEYSQLMDEIPGMSRKELSFIVSEAIPDAMREQAREELIARNLIRPHWEKPLMVAAVVLGMASSFVVLLRWWLNQ